MKPETSWVKILGQIHKNVYAPSWVHSQDQIKLEGVSRMHSRSKLYQTCTSFRSFSFFELPI
jgi:hypothetical protein